MAEPDLRRLLNLAERAVREAAVALVAERTECRTLEAEEGREVKLRADRQAEALIIETLRAESPYRILSEEIGWVAGDESDLVWAVDPLDGSVNYVQGFPHWAVSIALVRGFSPLLGVVECPALEETFTAIAGEEAWLNRAPISVSAVHDPMRGVLMTGIPARAAVDAQAMGTFALELARWRKVRMIGSAACALACVGAGRADAYHETGGMLWDVAGGLAIVAGAGGTVAVSGDTLDGPLDVKAWNGAVAIDPP